MALPVAAVLATTMPSLRLASFHLGIEIRAEVNIGARIEDTPYVEAPSTQNDDRERELSPIGQQMQKKVREQAKQHRTEAEREADEESLHLLEAAEATNTTMAKIMDKESLEWLIHCTKRLNKYRPTFKTPTRNSFWPKTRYLKGMNNTPLSFEPSNSTSSEVREMYEGKPINEFEEFLAKNRVQEGSEWLEKKGSRNSFTALLESAKRTNEPSSTGTPDSDGGSQVVGDDGSPSPILSVKHLPRDTGYLLVSVDDEEIRSSKPDSKDESEGSEEDEEWDLV